MASRDDAGGYLGQGRRIRRLGLPFFLLSAACCLFGAWTEGRHVYGQHYWPRVEATVVGIERMSRPNAPGGVHDSCSLAASWTDPAGTPHLNTFPTAAGNCLPGLPKPSRLILAYNPGQPEEAIEVGGWMELLMLAGFLGVTAGSLWVVLLLRRRP